MFAPVASLVLPRRIGQAQADDLLLSGRTVEGHEALALGLIDDMVDDPTEAALAYARTHLLPHSAASLRHAVRAVRHTFEAGLFGRLAEIEKLYLGELMKTADAVEGIEAFLEKRPPQWRNA